MKKQMENLELESIIIEKKKKASSRDKFYSRVEWTKRRIIELKGRTVEIIQPDQQGENWLKEKLTKSQRPAGL